MPLYLRSREEDLLYEIFFEEGPRWIRVNVFDTRCPSLSSSPWKFEGDEIRLGPHYRLTLKYQGEEVLVSGVLSPET